MHGAYGFIVLFSDRVEIASALAHIASDASEDADIGVGIDEDFDVEHVAERLETEEQDAFDDDDGNGIDVNGIVEESRVRFEVVERDVDGLTAFEPFEVIDE